jgi:hypothetical protein
MWDGARAHSTTGTPTRRTTLRAAGLYAWLGGGDVGEVGSHAQLVTGVGTLSGAGGGEGWGGGSGVRGGRGSRGGEWWGATPALAGTTEAKEPISAILP